jgi:hypothetical protein
MWRNRKMTTESALADLVQCRDYRAGDVAARVEELEGKRLRWEDEQGAAEVQAMLRARQKLFFSHPLVESFVDEFGPASYGKRGRWKPLAFLGESDTGKTWKAMSLFPNMTIKVSCNGLPPGIIPSLKNFSRRKHRAICFDEIRSDQVLGNRELFQSGPYACKLGQSACGQHEYSVWLYGIAIILCTNNLDVHTKSPTYDSDVAWLQHNIVRVELQPGQKWYLL